MGPILLSIGLFLTTIGVVLTIGERLGFKYLPVDILIQRGHVTFFFPIVTMLCLSIILTIIINLFRR